jgi:hypothetical protein
VGEVEIQAEADPRPVAHATGTYILPPTRRSPKPSDRGGEGDV